MTRRSQPMGPYYVCSFCDKGFADVGRMISGPDTIQICNECVDLCYQLLDEDRIPHSDVEIVVVSPTKSRVLEGSTVYVVVVTPATDPEVEAPPPPAPVEPES